MIKTLGMFGVVCGLAAQPLFAQDDAKPIDPVQLFLSRDVEERKQGRKLIFEGRARMISQLTAFICEPGHYPFRGTNVKEAMLMLGELRATEAIDVLVEHISFPLTPHPKTGELGPVISPSSFAKSPKRRMPAIAALIQIGDPCIDEVVKKLVTARGGIEVDACRAVLTELDQNSVRAQVTRAIENGDPQERKQLRKTLEMLGKSIPKDTGATPDY